MKIKPLKPCKIKYDRQVKMWTIIDPEAGVATQGKTKKELHEAYIEALRCMCWTYRDIYGRKPKKAK